MISFNKFLDTISNKFAEMFPPKSRISQYEALANLNPEKFYIENVRHALDIPFDQAEAVVREAVEEGYFLEGIEILCPDGTVALTVPDSNDIPDIVECQEMEQGSYEPVEYPAAKLNRKPYYRLASVR